LPVRRDPRVHLDRDLGAGLEREAVREGLPDALDLLEGEKRRRAASPVVLDEAGALPELSGHERDLALQVLDVRLGDPRLLRDDDVTPTEAAPLAAEGKVNIDRERLVGMRGRLFQLLDVPRRRESLVEFDGGRVRGVARAG